MATTNADTLTRVEKFSLKDADGSTDVAAEQLAATVLPALAAQCLLADFVKLEAGDVIVLNGGKSALGQSLLQLAAEKGLVTIAIEREHSAWAETVAHWGNLNPANIAASELFTQTPDFAKVLSDVPAPKLGIDCEGGRAGLVVAQTVGHGATVVSVGNASGHPLPLTADVLLTKGVHVTGFSLARWLQSAKKADVDTAVAHIVGKTAQGKLGTRVSWEPFKDFSIALKRAQDSEELPIVVVMDPPAERLR
jgi:trans-2-enoyl-CoA reductase